MIELMHVHAVASTPKLVPGVHYILNVGLSFFQECILTPSAKCSAFGHLTCSL